MIMFEQLYEFFGGLLALVGMAIIAVAAFCG